MILTQACSKILDQLADLLAQIREDDFAKPAETLSSSTIGQHLRHTLEFFSCLERGFNQGTINYDKRAHDKLIESDKFLAMAAIEKIKTFISNLTDKPLLLEVGYDVDKDEYVTLATNATRELVYNIEHAVHHMAIMKIGVREIAPYITLSADFGIAASTVRYREITAPTLH
jgi:uncharacterized damage-inducible protein DinB